jgi:hypothetical protein
MRMPRLRFTLRWQMIAVAVVCLVMAYGARWRAIQQRADRYDHQADAVLEFAREITSQSGGCGSWVIHGKSPEDFYKVVEARRLMSIECRRAAWRPWVVLSPEPPESSELVGLTLHEPGG